METIIAKQLLLKEYFFVLLVLIVCVISLSACARVPSSSETLEWEKSGDAESENMEPEKSTGAESEKPELANSSSESTHSRDDLWHSYQESYEDDFVYEHDFMTSRDGQGYHRWIYLEATYIMRDYGKKIGYDFTLDHWTVERIYPISGGYYNIVLSQNNHDISIDLLCHPDEKVYVILYAQYEEGDKTAGVNEMPYASQMWWQDYNLHESWEALDIENPYEDICEASVLQALYIPLWHYEQETGYDGEWYVRELFGRSPFFDYLVESEKGFVWFCVDIADCYTYVSFEIG